MPETSIFTQARVLFGRDLISAWRDGSISWMAGTLIYMNIVFVLIFRIEKTGFGIFTLLFIVIQAVLPIALKAPEEMSKARQEHQNNRYSWESYCLAKAIVDLLLQSLCPLMFSSVVYVQVHTFEASTFLLFTTQCIVTAQVATSLAHLFAAASSDALVTLVGGIFTTITLVICLRLPADSCEATLYTDPRMLVMSVPVVHMANLLHPFEICCFTCFSLERLQFTQKIKKSVNKCPFK